MVTPSLEPRKTAAFKLVPTAEISQLSGHQQFRGVSASTGRHGERGPLLRSRTACLSSSVVAPRKANGFVAFDHEVAPSRTSKLRTKKQYCPSFTVRWPPPRPGLRPPSAALRNALPNRPRPHRPDERSIISGSKMAGEAAQKGVNVRRLSASISVTAPEGVWTAPEMGHCPEGIV